jgi:H+/Cl- antiporter ClcA
MCETISYLFSFALGMIAGGVGLYYKLLKDIKAFEKEYEPVLLLLKEKQNEI